MPGRLRPKRKAAEGSTRTNSRAARLANWISRLYVDDKAPKVTKDVFKGYALYNSYCFRCHGTDATGAELAPDLRASLVAGMKQQTFMSVAMAGKKEKGMPSWAGFLSEDGYGQSLQICERAKPRFDTSRQAPVRDGLIDTKRRP